MNAENVHIGEWYVYLDGWPWLITGVDDWNCVRPAFIAVNENYNDGIVFASELTPTEL